MAIILKPHQTQELIDSLELVFNDEIEYTVDNYSGRNMYGRTCIGIVAKDYNELLIQLTVHLSNTDNDNVISSYKKQFEYYKLDNMGKSYIVYFPDILTDFQYEDNSE